MVIKGEAVLGAEATGKQYFEVVTTGLRACVGMQNSNDVLVHHDRDMGGVGVRDGQRQGMDRSIDIIVLGTRYWVGSFTYTNLFIYLFIYFWLHWVFVAAHGLSLVAVSGGYSSLRCIGFSLQWLLLLWSMGCRCAGFSSCGTRAQ